MRLRLCVLDGNKGVANMGLRSRRRFLARNQTARLIGSIGGGYGGRQMREYQAYVLGEDGHIKQRIDLTCADDDAARQQAASLGDGHPLELWQSDRKIARFEPCLLTPQKPPACSTTQLTPHTTA